MNLREKAVQYMETNDLTEAELCRRAEINPSTFNLWKNGKYVGNPNAIEKPLSNFLEKEEERIKKISSSEIVFIDTTISKRIKDVLDYCRLQNIVGCIYGDAGVGKTRTTKEWIKNKSDVVYITATVAFSTPKPFFKRLARELNSVRTGQLDDIYSDIVDKLEQKDRTIIIDEAQHLTLKTLELVRSLNDETSTSIVLIGNAMVYNKLLGRQQAEFAQLFSRIGIKLHVITDNFSLEDMERLFKDNLNDSSTKYLLEIGKGKYGLRGAINVYINAGNNGDTSKKGLKAIAYAMGILT